jgi:hypothetical protein
MNTRFWLVVVALLALPACVSPADPSAPAPAADNVAAASLAVSAPNCPTASETLPISFWYWRTRRTLDGFVWANDGTNILGIETLVEEKYTPSLFGWKVITQKPCHQLFWTTLGSSDRTNIGGPSELEIVNAYAFYDQHYIAIEKHSGTSNWQLERVDTVKNSGTRTPYAAITGTCDWARAIPSPKGDTVAYVHSSANPCTPGSLAPSATTVTFFNAAGALQPGKASFTMSGFAQGTWRPDEQLVVSDGNTAVTVAIDGTVAPTSVPRCTDPPTTSSTVDAKGQLLDINDGKPAVVAVDVSRAFGCQ